MDTINLTGKKFGKLTVISTYRKKDASNMNRTYCNCLCECGNNTTTRAYCLKDGKTKSCGCLMISSHQKRPYESIYNNLVKNAGNRNILLELTYEDYLELTKNERCHYCDRIIDWHPYTGKNITENRSYCSKNNLDRKDNLLPYSKENCVVCCWPCNELKGNRLSYEEMIMLKPSLIAIREEREKKEDYKYNGTLNTSTH
jgi:hypothetical protein